MRRMPKWLKVLLVVAAIIFLGPPAVGLVFAALGLAIGVTAGLFKLALLGAGIYALVMVLQAIFGGPKTPERRLERAVSQVDAMEASRKALDDELERALAEARKTTS